MRFFLFSEKELWFGWFRGIIYVRVSILYRFIFKIYNSHIVVEGEKNEKRQMVKSSI